MTAQKKQKRANCHGCRIDAGRIDTTLQANGDEARRAAKREDDRAASFG